MKRVVLLYALTAIVSNYSLTFTYAQEVAAPQPNVQLVPTDTIDGNEASSPNLPADTTTTIDTTISSGLDSTSIIVFIDEQFEKEPATHGDLNVAWRYDAEDDILHQEMTPFGTLLVSTSSRTVSLNPATGDILWSSDDLRDYGMFERRGVFGSRHATNEFHCRFRDRDGYTVHKLGILNLLVRSERKAGFSFDRIVAFDIAKGGPLWDSDSAGLRIAKDAWKLRIDLGLLLAWNAGPSGFTTVSAVDIVTGEVRWAAKVPFVGGKLETTPARGTEIVSGKTVDKKKAVAAIDLHNGEVRFVSNELGVPFDEDERQLLTVSTYAIDNSKEVDLATVFGYPLEVLHTDDDVMTAFDAETGQVKWSAPRIPLGIWVYDSSMVYVAGGGKVFAVSLKDGSTRWSMKKKVSRMAITNHGLLLGCDRDGCENEIMLIDPMKGQLWSKSIDFDVPNAAALWKGDSIFLATPTSLYRVDIPSGEYNQIATFHFEGYGGTALQRNYGKTVLIAEFKDDILLSDNENVSLFGTDGIVRFSEHYPTPGMSFGDIALRVGGALALTAISVAAATVSAQVQARQMAQISALSGGSGSGIGIAFYQVYFPNLTERYKSALRLPNDMYFYTDRDDSLGREGFSLVRFNLDQGRETARVWIDERRPNYLIDPINGLVILTRESEGPALARRESVLEAVKIQP